jgi:hypothetical protein
MRRFALILLFFILCNPAPAQKLSLGGYIKDMQGIYYFDNPIDPGNGEMFRWTTYNQMHNRLNINFQATEKLRFELGVRTRLLAGKLISDISGYTTSFGNDNGIVDLAWNVTEQKKWFLNTSVDRLYFDYTLGKVQLRAGRQRINWGINLVWNPNDLFNAFSYMDFDYEERPGSDALLLTWYTSGSSSLDIAFKTGKNHLSTFAARYLFNIFDYDIQLIGGKYENDFVFGGGWSGSIGNISFRGEGTFFTPLPGKKAISETSVSMTLSADYTFSNSLYVHSAFLYNSTGTTGTGSGISLISPNFNLSAKQLSTGKYELFGQISYPFSPILNGDIACMLNPSDGSIYLGPTASVSVANNIELMVTSQLLLGKDGSEYGSMGNICVCFGRLRWSF